MGIVSCGAGVALLVESKGGIGWCGTVASNLVTSALVRPTVLYGALSGGAGLGAAKSCFSERSKEASDAGLAGEIGPAVEKREKKRFMADGEQGRPSCRLRYEAVFTCVEMAGKRLPQKILI